MEPEFFFSAIEVISQFEGLIGALLGAYAGFFGSYFTARHSQRLEMEKFERDITRVAKDRTSAGTASLLDLTMKTGAAGLRNHEQVSELAHQLVLFSVREMNDHPDAARWAHMQAEQLSKASRLDQHFASLMWQVQRISDKLFKWVREDYRDDFFDTTSDEPIRKEVIDSLDPTLYVSRADAIDPEEKDLRKMQAACDQLGLDFYEVDRSR